MYRCALGAVLVCVMGASPAWGQDAEVSNKVNIKGQEFEIYPPDKLRARGLEVPEIPQDQNAAWVYLDAMNAMVDLPTDLSEAFESALDGTWPEGETGDKLAGWLEQNRASLDLVRRASTMDEYYMPFFRGDTNAMIGMLLPTLTPTRQLSKTLSVDAAYQMSNGDAAAAIENYLTVQRMGNHVGNGKTLIEGLVGIAVGGVAEQGMMRVAQSGEVDSETLQAAVAEMEGLADSFPTFEHMVRAEQQWAESFIDDAFEMPSVFGAISGWGIGGVITQPSPNGWSLLRTRLRRLYLPDRAIKKHFRAHYDALIEATRHEDGSVGMVFDEAKQFGKIPAWDIISRMVVPSLARAYELTLRAESNYVRARMTMAVEAYKSDHGDYPPTLPALVPTYAASVPPDPMTGYDFEYKPAADGASGVDGLHRITRDDETALRQKRRTPAILSPRASKWRRYVQSFCEQHELTDAQRGSADGILRNLEARAGRFEQVHGAKLQKLTDAGKTKELERETDPLAKMFEELRQRLHTIPTAEQRAAAEAKKTKKNNGKKARKLPTTKP